MHNSWPDDSATGIKVGSTNGFTNSNIEVNNNLIWNVNAPYDNTYGMWLGECAHCSILSNTLYANTNTMLEENNINPVIKNNLAYANLKDQDAMRNTLQDPLFFNASAGDFHLQPVSRDWLTYWGLPLRITRFRSSPLFTHAIRVEHKYLSDKNR